MNFSIHRWQEGHSVFTKEEILAAAAAAHKQPQASEEWFNWKYLNSPLGSALIVYAQEEHGDLAGVLIFGMYSHIIDNVEYKTALSYETFVLSKYRGQRLFLRLIERCITELTNEGVHFIFNYPNAASLPGFLKTGWTHRDIVDYYIKVNLSANVLLHARDIRKPFVEDKANTTIDINHYYDNYHQLNTDRSVIPQRKKEYFEWRYNGANGNHYILANTKFGKALLRKGKRGKLTELQLLDFNVANSDYDVFFSVLHKQLKKEHSFDIIGVALSSDHEAVAQIRKRYWKVPTKANFTYYVLNDHLKDKLDSYKWPFTANEFHTY